MPSAAARCLALPVLSLSLAFPARAEPPALPLWEGGAPGAKGTGPADSPALFAHLPETPAPDGTAVIICPGGGYGALMMGYEGHDVARWLNRQGIAGLVLRYRHGPTYHHPAPFDDVSRALRLARSRAAEWKIHPDRIGVMGFSAGGHLAATLATHFDAGRADAADPVDRLSSRPAFQILIYPVITMKTPLGHAGSRGNLLGPDPDPALIDFLSNETRVTAQTPPAWIVHSVADRVVPVDHARLYAEACRAQQVPVAYLELEQGGHGLGAGKGPLWEQWQTACVAWLEKRRK